MSLEEPLPWRVKAKPSESEMARDWAAFEALEQGGF